jgi:hypothetical protein
MSLAGRAGEAYNDRRRVGSISALSEPLRPGRIGGAAGGSFGDLAIKTPQTLSRPSSPL